MIGDNESAAVGMFDKVGAYRARAEEETIGFECVATKIRALGGRAERG